jgi:hypothetical protein
MQTGLKCIKNSNSPEFPGYLTANDDFRYRASPNPRESLCSGTNMPGFITVRDLKQLQKEGRSPLKTAA